MKCNPGTYRTLYGSFMRRNGGNVPLGHPFIVQLTGLLPPSHSLLLLNSLVLLSPLWIHQDKFLLALPCPRFLDPIYRFQHLSCLCHDSYLCAQRTDAASQPGRLTHFSSPGLDLCHISDYALRLCFHGCLPGKHVWLGHFFVKSCFPASVPCLLLCLPCCLLGITRSHDYKGSGERNLPLFYHEYFPTITSHIVLQTAWTENAEAT